MRLVASFTTIPSRIDKIRPMVESMLVQTLKPDKLVLWIPSRCAKEGSEYVIPGWLLSLPVSVLCCGCDYGPATKLVPSLLDEEFGDTRIVSLDDDVAYESHALEELAEASMRWPDKVIGFMGGREGPQFVHAESILPPIEFEPVDVLGGYRGVIYRRGLFDDSIFRDLTTLMEQGPFVCDDQLFGWNLLRRNIDRVVVRTRHTGPNGTLNFKFLGLGGSIYGENNKLADESIRRIKELYDKNGWRRSS